MKAEIVTGDTSGASSDVHQRGSNTVLVGLEVGSHFGGHLVVQRVEGWEVRFGTKRCDKKLPQSRGGAGSREKCKVCEPRPRPRLLSGASLDRHSHISQDCRDDRL